MTNSAAVLPFADYHNTRYCYFALENRGTLSTFGGGLNKGESVKKGALREWQEESLGIFGHSKNLAHKLKKISHDRLFATKTHTTFFPSVDVHGKNVLETFSKTRKKKWNHLSRCQKEVKEIIAVSKNTLLQALRTGNNSFQGHPVRHCVWQNLLAAYNAGKLTNS